MIGRMGKYARVYTKKILAKTKLSGLDDYGFMATLMFRESMTKSELTHHNLMESVTSGADIIKRLVKHGYVEEFDDEDDKRSRRVRITQVGKLLMFKIFEEMDTVSSIITGNLTGDEKLFLLHYLNKLDNLHTDIYNNDRKAELEAIKMKYIIG
jgi:DNA-binding MarR family transcriptional regulator